MNSPSGTVRLMPFTAGTSPNFLTMSLVTTADIQPPRISVRRTRSAVPWAEGGSLFICRFYSCALIGPGPRVNARPGPSRSGLAGPFLHDDLALMRGPFDRVFRAQLACRGLRHHVV